MPDPIALNFDPVPVPVARYAEAWGRDEKTLNAWCAKGWVPGAFKHPSGQWWVRPLDLLGWDGTVPEAPESSRCEPERVGKRGGAGRPVLRQVARKRTDRLW